MPKKIDREVVAAKVAIEEEWAYDRRVERLSWRQMRDRSALPVEQGGLGYLLGIATLQARADAYFAQIRGTLRVGVDERRARQEGEIDELIRLAIGDIKVARAAGDVKASADAELRLLRYQEREAKIFGTDSPQRIEAEVTNRDAVLEDLNAALVSLGREPVETA
ncbi:hypothetical protein [uncultured Microbacterium sp.]|uniref:hypothetical protein n=1 Tax=uncultured Microbacterium sp. TaxID=191216 RepID=UPI002625ED6A|nr:hypothetical protein [uncultured Microbacterium sp.]